MLLVCSTHATAAQHGRARNRSSAPARQSAGEHDAPLAGHDAPLEEFERMSAAEQEKAISELPASRREKIQKELETYSHLTPAQKRDLDWFLHLPAERQQVFRQAYRKFQTESPGRKQALRTEMQRLQTMSAHQRNARLTSPEFRSTFDKDEQEILKQMSDTLPKR
jgi:hypothetical protein